MLTQSRDVKTTFLLFWRRFNVHITLFQRRVPAGNALISTHPKGDMSSEEKFRNTNFFVVLGCYQIKFRPCQKILWNFIKFYSTKILSFNLLMHNVYKVVILPEQSKYVVLLVHYLLVCDHLVKVTIIKG